MQCANFLPVGCAYSILWCSKRAVNIKPAYTRSTMGWAMIHRLMAVYITMRTSMGYWLLRAALWSFIVRRAITWAR